MIMEPTSEVVLYDLLRQREHSFAQIYEYERRIHNILGQPYSAYSQPAIPSTKKKRKPQKKNKIAKRTIRRLKPSVEDAYLVHYSYNGIKKHEVLREYRLVQLLVKEKIENIELINISSIYYSSDYDYDIVVELLSFK